MHILTYVQVYVIVAYFYKCTVEFLNTVQFSHSVMSNSLRPHGLQHARIPCPSPTPRACPNSCPLSWWCHATISSSVICFSSCLQSSSARGSSPKSWFFLSGSQSIGASASASVRPMNIQDWFPLGCDQYQNQTYYILCSQRWRSST